MYRFNIFILALFFSSTTWSQGKISETYTSKATPAMRISSLSFSYFSWKEFLTTSKNGQSDHGYANFIGNSLSYEYESYWVPRWGAMIDVSLLQGQATLGGTMTHIPYQMSSVRWWGLEASYRPAYRYSTSVTVSAGPTLLMRQMNLPTDPNGASVKSGANLNYGLIANLNLQLSKKCELRQSLGTLLADASTIWSLGIGYIF